MRPTLRSALARERPLVTPLAHDALSARLIARAGFHAFTIGGSALLASRYGLPDIGLIGLADMVAGIRDIADACPLPFMADGDDGYGDVKSVARTVEAYEAIGVGGILFEDQERDRKQQRADKAQGVVDRRVIEAKLRAALAARRSAETLIIGRTDAYGVAGLDEALARGERFLALGADGVFVAGARTMQDLERIGRAFKGATLLSAALFETPGDPIRGNPRGDVTIVEFFDVRCPYCKRLHGEMAEVLRRDRNLRIIMKDLPILGPQSVVGARALLAAQRQGKYPELYDALMRLRGEPTDEAIRAEAQRVGLDANRLFRDMQDPAIQRRLDDNIALARTLQIEGTPALVVGDTLIPGAVPAAQLERLVQVERERRR